MRYLNSLQEEEEAMQLQNVYPLCYQGIHLTLQQQLVNYVKQNDELAFVQTYSLTLPGEFFFHSVWHKEIQLGMLQNCSHWQL